ncbi:MAG: pyridoxal-phosphate-dependent aminotransferase family protein [Acidimicrobiales bacterium]
MVGRDFIQNPGPTNIPDRVLEAFRRPATDFDGPEFATLIEEVWDELPALFGGAHRVIVLTSVGHGAWESALVNLLAPGERALFATGGIFGAGWAAAAQNLGFLTDVTPIDFRRAPDPETVFDILSNDRERAIKAVCVAQTETSTGTVVDIPGFRSALDSADHPAFLVVDSIGSLGTEPMLMADWGVDVVLAASQKGLMMPPGLAFCAISKSALQKSMTGPSPAAYWAWPPRLGVERAYMRFGGTPPEQHIYALKVALELIAEEGGAEAVATRHCRTANAVHACVDAWGSGGPWEINASEPGERASAVTCVRTGELDSIALIAAARDRYSVTLGSGMGELEGRAFRIGHLGDLNEPMILGALGAIETTMTHLGFPYGAGVSAAARCLGSAQA